MKILSGTACTHAVPLLYALGRLFDNLAEHLARAACRVGFVGIDMHRRTECRADTDHHIAEHERTLGRIDFNGNNVLVLDPHLLGKRRIEVAVTLGNNHALL